MLNQQTIAFNNANANNLLMSDSNNMNITGRNGSALGHNTSSNHGVINSWANNPTLQ